MQCAESSLLEYNTVKSVEIKPAFRKESFASFFRVEGQASFYPLFPQQLFLAYSSILKLRGEMSL
jgi:hypothetical protein